MASNGAGAAPAEDTLEDDDDPAATGGFLTTKHEILEAEITIPDIESVDPSERLEKIGEVMNVFGQVAIVRGMPSEDIRRGSQKALDSETLLVFEDRTVMGYVRVGNPFFPGRLLIAVVSDRYTKPLDLQISRFIKSSTTASTLWMQRE